jgi:rare lipoprotein A
MKKHVNWPLTWIPFFWLLLGLGGCASVLLEPPYNSTKPQSTINSPRFSSPARKTFQRIDIRDYIARGKAFWYNVKEHGARTASGQIYDLYGITAAHATLPLMSQVKIKNLRTGRSLVVTINDRLENNNQALIKLSYWAARRLGLIKRSPSKSKIEIRGL